MWLSIRPSRALVVLGLAFGLSACMEAEPQGDADPSLDDAASERGPLGKVDAPGSCAAPDGDDFCGGKSDGACWCDELCAMFGDCCGDKQPVCDGVDPGPALCMSDATCEAGEVCDHSECLSNCPPGLFCPTVCWGQCQDASEPPPADPNTCEGACGGAAEGNCWCDDLCSTYGDCCADYEAECAEPVQSCEAIVEEFAAETAEIRSCTAAAECGQVLAGTSCGCTRNWVARADADLAEWEALRDTAFENGCGPPIHGERRR